MGKVAALSELNMAEREISRRTHISRTTVQRWIANDFPLNRRRGSGRPTKMTARATRLLVRTATNNPTFSIPELSTAIGVDVDRTTVWRCMKKAGFKSFKRGGIFYLTQRHKHARVDWAMRRSLWRLPSWRRVVFSDEASVKLMSRDGRLRVWLRGERHRRNDLALPVVQAGGGGVMMWGAIWFGGKSELYITRQSVNSERYVEILEQFVYPISYDLGDPGTNWMFMDDNAPPHRSLAAQAFKNQSGIRTIDWPARSPDLNPIENVWSWMKRRVRMMLQPHDTLDRLEELLHQIWLIIPQEFIDSLIVGMPKRLGEVLRNHGGHASY